MRAPVFATILELRLALFFARRSRTYGFIGGAGIPSKRSNTRKTTVVRIFARMWRLLFYR
jgi:hypothetical protein